MQARDEPRNVGGLTGDGECSGDLRFTCTLGVELSQGTECVNIMLAFLCAYDRRSRFKVIPLLLELKS